VYKKVFFYIILSYSQVLYTMRVRVFYHVSPSLGMGKRSG